MKFWPTVTLLLHIGLVNGVSNDLKHNNDEDINESRRKQFLEQNDSVSPELLSSTIEVEKPEEKLTARLTDDLQDEIKLPRRIDDFGSEKYNVVKTTYLENNEKSKASTTTEKVLLIFPDGNGEHTERYNPTMDTEKLNANDKNDKPLSSQNYENNNSEKFNTAKKSDSHEQFNVQNYLNDTEKHNFSEESESSEYLKFQNSSNDTEKSNSSNHSESIENLNNQKYENHSVKNDSNSETESVNNKNSNKEIKEVPKNGENVRTIIRRLIIRKRIPENKMALKENDDIETTTEIIMRERMLSQIHQNLYRRRPSGTFFTLGKINKNNDHQIEENYKTEDLTTDGTNNSFSIINFNSTILKTEDNVNSNNNTREEMFHIINNLRPVTRRQANIRRNNQEKLIPNPVERHHINNEETENYDEHNFENYESRKIIPKNPTSQRIKEKQSDFTDTRTSVTLKDMKELIGPASQHKTQHPTVGIDQTMNQRIRSRTKINASQRNKTLNPPESYNINKIMLVEKFLKNVLLKEFEKIKAETSERNQRISNKILNKRLRNQKGNDNFQSNQERLNIGVKETVLNNGNMQNGRSEDFRRYRTNSNKSNYITKHKINNEEETKSNIQRSLNEEGTLGSNRKRSTDAVMAKQDRTASDDMFNETDLMDSGSEIHEQKIYPAPSAQPNNLENRYIQDTSRPLLIIGVIPRKIGRANLTYDIDETKESQVRYPAPIAKSDNADYQNTTEHEYGGTEIIPDTKVTDRISDKKEHSDGKTKINENVKQNNVIIKKENLREVKYEPRKNCNKE